MEMSNLGSRYASALLSIALDENKNAEYREYIKAIYSLIEEDNSLIRLLDSKDISKDDKKVIIDKVFVSCPYDSIKNFFKVIIDNSRALYLKDILKDFISLSNAKDNISEGYIYSAQKLSKEQIASISKAISKKIEKQVFLKPRIDEDLIGGFKVVINDYVFDATIKNQVEELKNSLKGRS